MHDVLRHNFDYLGYDEITVVVKHKFKKVRPKAIEHIYLLRLFKNVEGSLNNTASIFVAAE
jgi:hypothetical protein